MMTPEPVNKNQSYHRKKPLFLILMVLVMAPLLLNAMDGRGEDRDDSSHDHDQERSPPTVSSNVPDQYGDGALESDNRGNDNHSRQTPSNRNHLEEPNKKPDPMNIDNTNLNRPPASNSRIPLNGAGGGRTTPSGEMDGHYLQQLDHSRSSSPSFSDPDLSGSEDSRRTGTSIPRQIATGITPRQITAWMNARTKEAREIAFANITGESSSSSASVLMLPYEQERIRAALEKLANDSSASRELMTSQEFLAQHKQDMTGSLVADFLVGDLEKEKEEYQQEYDEALNELKRLSPQLAEVMSSEEVPKTDEEVLASRSKWEGLIENSAPENKKEQDQLGLCITRLYGLKAAVNVLDLARLHRNYFLNAPKNNIDLEENSFYHEQSNSINTIQELHSAVVSILKATRIMVRCYPEWHLARDFKEECDHIDWEQGGPPDPPTLNLASFRSNIGFDTAFRHLEALMHYSEEVMHSSTRYAEAVRDQNIQQAHVFKTKVQWSSQIVGFCLQAEIYFQNEVEASTHGNDYLSEQWLSAGELSFEAAEALIEGNHEKISELESKILSILAQINSGVYSK